MKAGSYEGKLLRPGAKQLKEREMREAKSTQDCLKLG
jgi:hypothetical protein